MELADIREEAVQFAEIISKTVDVDVIIADRGLHAIANTFRCFDRFSYIGRASVVAEVIAGGKVVVVDDKSSFGVCKGCPDFCRCDMSGLVGVPILYKGKVAGAICLILVKNRFSHIFRNIRHIVGFLEQMAELLASKLQNCDEYTALQLEQRRREALMDVIEDAIVSTDDAGRITCCNRAFEALFGGGPPAGTLLCDVLPSRHLLSFLERKAEETGVCVSFENRGRPWYGMLSCRRVRLDERREGMIFIFRPMDRMDPASCWNRREEAPGPEPFSQKTLEKALRLAGEGGPVLLLGEEGLRQEELARTIHRAGPGRRRGFITLHWERAQGGGDMDSFFQEFGPLHFAQGGSVFFDGIHRMPLFFQERLADFIEDPLLRGGRETRVEVRLLFSAAPGLERLAEGGRFSRRLHQMISARTLSVPPLREEAQLLKRLIVSRLESRGRLYGKSRLTLSGEALETLCAAPWPRNLRQIETAVDLLAANAKSTVVTKEDLEPCRDLIGLEETKTISSIERDTILKLLETAQSKDEAARALGIGRATLYRKLRAYHLHEQGRTTP